MFKTIELFILLLCAFLFCNKKVFGQDNSIVVQKRSIPCIDGVIDQGEWDDAIKHELKGGRFVSFKRAKDTLYVAIKGSTGGICSLALGNTKSIDILHASTGLISANYKPGTNGWNSMNGFEEPMESNGKPFARGPVRHKKRYLIANLLNFGWYSNLVEMGDVSEFEYAISLDRFRQKPLYFNLVFFQVKAKIKYAKFPENLSDESLNRTLVAGGAPSGLQFYPEKWIRLEF